MGARDATAEDLAQAEALEAAIWAEFMAPPPAFTVTEWAERNRVLSGKDSAEPGPYRADRTPYAREPMDCLSANSPVEEVILMWGAQTSKTTIGSNWIGYLADINPGPVMIVQPTIDMAKRYSRQRLVPMIEESPVLRRKVRENRSRDEANTTLLKEFAGGFLAIAGANSAAGLRSMPVRDLFTDEEDAYPVDVDGEGDPVQLARARQTTFARRKHLRTSTPTTKDFSRIETAYLASDRCQYHVACPHCGEFQALEWGAAAEWGVKWDKDPEGRAMPHTARYVCRANGCEIREHHKPKMLAGGYWLAANPGAQAGKVRGFQLSSLYSPLGWLSWQTLVAEWQAAQDARRAGDVSLLRVFINTRLEAYAWAWGRGLERQLVDRAVFYGDPALPETEDGSPWAALTEWRRMPIQHASGKPVPVLGCGIDTGGHHTQAVYTYVRAHQHANVLALKGASQSGRAIIGKPTDQDISYRGQKLKRGVKLWPVGTDTAKAEIYGRLRIAEPGPGFVHLSKHLPPDVFEQLTAERIVTRYVKGHPKLEWVKPAGRRNEALDCAVYALAVAHKCGIDRWREADWSTWEARVQARDLFDQPPPAAPPVPAAAPAADPIANTLQARRRAPARGGFATSW